MMLLYPELCSTRRQSGLRAMMVWSMFYLSMDCGGHGATYGAQFRGEMALKGPKTATDSCRLLSSTVLQLLCTAGVC